MTQNSSKDPRRFQGEAADRPNENTSVSAAADNAADKPKAPVHQRRKPAEDAGHSAAQKTSRPIGRGYFRPAQKTAAQLRDERNERVIYDILAKFDKKENEAQSSGQSEKTAGKTDTAAAANTAENADLHTAGRRGKGGNRPENGRTKGKEKTAAKKPESGMHAAGRSGRSAADAADSAKETAKGGRGETVRAAKTAPAVRKLTGGTLPVPAGVQRAKVVRTPRADKPEAVRVKRDDGARLRVMILGGLQEIGKNMTVIEYKNDIIVIDCGVAFPDDDLLGVDLVIPDTTYLEKNADRVRGILITHGHEDHIGAVPYVLQKIRVPVYGTRLTMGIIKNKLKEANLSYRPDLYTVEAGDTVKLGCFGCEFIHVNHSIADACAIAVTTPVGVVFHTGDFKLDVSPIDGQIMDLTRIGEIGRKGVLLMLGESTNAERPGFTPSERTVGSSLDQIFMTHKDKRIVVATFSSNVHRVQQVIDTSVKYGRKVAILGRSMVNVIGAAMELGYMELPEGTLIDISDIRRFRPDQLTLVTTGSQGEPMSALYRMAFGEHDKVKLSSSDLVVLSASAIPGNEKLVDKIINALVRYGIRVVNDRVSDVHVSGHACAEELKLMHALVRPKFFMPIHGENRHLYAHKEIAEFMGMPSNHIFLPELGRVLELGPDSARWNGTVPSGRVLIDGTGIGDVGQVVLRDRKLLAEEGLIVVAVGIDARDGSIVSGPDIISRGYVYVKESGDLMDEARLCAAEAVGKCLKGRKNPDLAQIKATLRDEMSRFFFKANKRSPVILPILVTV